jgi:hypothetical protein
MSSSKENLLNKKTPLIRAPRPSGLGFFKGLFGTRKKLGSKIRDRPRYLKYKEKLAKIAKYDPTKYGSLKNRFFPSNATYTKRMSMSNPATGDVIADLARFNKEEDPLYHIRLSDMGALHQQKDERKAAERKAAASLERHEDERKAALSAKRQEDERKAASLAKRQEDERKAALSERREAERKAASLAKRQEDERKAAAAIKIQKSLRGYKSRRNLNGVFKDVETPEKTPPTHLEPIQEERTSQNTPVNALRNSPNHRAIVPNNSSMGSAPPEEAVRNSPNERERIRKETEEQIIEYVQKCKNEKWVQESSSKLKSIAQKTRALIDRLMRVREVKIGTTTAFYNIVSIWTWANKIIEQLKNNVDGNIDGLVNSTSFGDQGPTEFVAKYEKEGIVYDHLFVTDDPYNLIISSFNFDGNFVLKPFLKKSIEAIPNIATTRDLSNLISRISKKDAEDPALDIIITNVVRILLCIIYICEQSRNYMKVYITMFASSKPVNQLPKHVPRPTDEYTFFINEIDSVINTCNKNFNNITELDPSFKDKFNGGGAKKKRKSIRKKRFIKAKFQSRRR